MIICGLVVLSPNLIFAKDNQPLNRVNQLKQGQQELLSPEDRDWLQTHKNITFGYTDAFEPELIVNPDGSYRGTLIDVLDLVNKRLGTDIEVIVKPIPDLINQVNKKELAGVLAIHPTYADKLGWLTTQSYMTSYPTVFAKKGFNFNTPTDLAGKKIALIDKIFFTQNLVNIYGEEVTLVKVESALKGMEKVRDGTVDLFIGSSSNSYLLGKYQFFDLATAFQFYDYPITNVMGVRSDWPQLVSILNKGLQAISVEEIEAIYLKWISSPEQNEVTDLPPEERAWLNAHPNIVLSYTDAFEPELIVNPDGSHSGILVDFLDELNRRLGTSITLRIDSIPGLIQKAKNKEVDGILEIHPDYADKLGLLKSIGYLSAYPAVFARKNVSFAGPDDFSGKKIAIIDNVYFSEKMLREYGEQVTILRVKNAIQGMKSVSEGDADLYIGVSFNSYYITKYQLYDVVIKYIFRNFPDKFGMAVRPDWPELVPILNKGISSFSQNDIDAIVANWVHLPQQEKTGELTPDEQAWLAEHPEIRFAFSVDYPPALILDEDGHLSGMLKDVIDLLNQRLGSNFGITVAEIKAVREMVVNKEVAGQLALTAGNGASRGLLETHVLWETYPVIYAPKDSPMKINALEDLKGKAVSTLKGSRYAEKILGPYEDKIDIVRTDTIVEAFRLLYEGKVDYMIGLTSQAYYLTKMRFLTLEPAFVMTDRPTKIVMGVRDDWPKLVEILNKGLKSITEDEWLTINNKWLGAPDIIPPQLSLTLEEQAWLKENNNVRVRAVDWPPYMIINENKPPQGITVEYLKLIEERTGINFDYEVTKQPFSKFLENMKRGQGPDMTPLINQSPEREQFLSFTTPYISSPYVIFAREQENIVLDIDGLAGKTVAIPNGFIIQQLLERDYPDIKLVLFDNDEQALLAVSTGKVEGYIGNLIAATHIIQKRGLSNLRVVASTRYGDQALSMGNRNDWPELTSIIDKVLTNITEEEKTAIRNKYISLRYEQGIDRAEVMKWALVFAIASATILLLILFWNRQLASKVKQRTVALETEMSGHLLTHASLAESEARFRATFEQAAVGIIHVSLGGQFLRINQQLCNMTGYMHEEMLQLTFHDITPAKDLDAEIKQFKRLISGAISTIISEKKYSRKDGTPLWVIVTVSLVRNEEAQPQWFVAMVSDISERKKAQLALSQMREYTDHLIQTAHVIIIGLDNQGKVTLFNPAAEKITGYTFSEIQEKNWFDTLVPLDRYPEVHEEFNRLMQGGLPQFFENPILTKCGHERYISWSNSEIRNDEEIVGLTSFGIDITERKLAEKSLIESEEQFRQLVEQAPFSIQILNPAGRITKVNDAFMELWGFREDVLVEVLEKYNIFEDEEAIKRGIMPLIERAFKGETVSIPILEFDAEITIDALNVSVIANKRWIKPTLYPVKNLQGEIVSIVDIEEDVTERMQVEERVQRYQLRLKALASQLTIVEEKERRRLAADLHDHVGQSLVFSRIQLSDLKEQTSDEKFIKSIDEVSQTLLTVIKDTRELVFDLSSPLLHEVGLGAATSQWLRDDIGKKYGIETECIDSAGTILQDNEMNDLLFRNIRELLTNVVKHAYANKVSVHFNTDKDNLIIMVQDNGIGFYYDPVVDAVSSQSGFGLFSIRERIDDVGGLFEIESEPGKGCSVTMTIPLSV